MTTYDKRPGFQREATTTNLTEIGIAENVIYTTYGDRVSVEAKAKNLDKFGGNVVVGETYETVAQLQGTVSNETYVSTNLIDSIVSTSASDTTQVITIEGHTIDLLGNLTFVTQDATLTGQTEVTLTTPLARAHRAYVKDSGTFNSPYAALVGILYIYDNTGGITAGVPNTPAATKLLINAGATTSEKCATSLSSTDYWIVTLFGAGVGVVGGNAERVGFRIETRDVRNGGVWIPLSREIVIDTDQNDTSIQLKPHIIIPKNHDFRVRSRTNANTASVFSEVAGYLAKIIT